MDEIIETPLPGVGTRHELQLDSGRRIGVITRHSGRRELVVYDRHDPDAAEVTLELSTDEGRTLADLLGGGRLTRQVEAAVGQIEGLAIDWLTVPGGAAPRTIADTELRQRTGVSIIAIVRDGEARPAPGPDADLRGGDVLVVTGTPAGIGEAAALLGA